MADVRQIVFRTYGEVPCLIPFLALSVVLQLLLRWWPEVDATIITWIWICGLAATIIMICFDLSMKGTFILVITTVAAWAVGRVFGVIFIGPLVAWLGSHNPIVSQGAIEVVSYTILAILFAAWIFERLNFYEISANRIEKISLGHVDFNQDTSGLSITRRNRNFLKLLIGIGDLVITRDQAILLIIEDVPFLSWGRWKAIQNVLESRSVVLNR